jgi:hypothetical protein
MSRPTFSLHTGGSGKTTMATRLYNRIPSLPQRAMLNLDADDPQGKQTQKHLVSALEQLGATDVNDSANAAQLLTRLRDLVAKTPVLLVVDNVWSAAQLDGLLPTTFHPGSQLIITSRLTDLRDSASYRVSLSLGA